MIPTRLLLSLATALGLATGLASAPSARADDAPPPADVTARAREAGADTTPSRLELSGDVVAQTLNTYLYRGFRTEDEGLIVQAWTDVHAKVAVGGFLDSVDFHGQFWNSFGTGPTGTGGPNDAPRAWSEADLILGVALAARGGFSVDATYTWLRAPNASFEDIDEVGLTFAYDDSDAWKDRPGAFRGWNPSIGLAVETRGHEDLTGTTGAYLGFGLAPAFSAWNAEDAPTISVPVTLGTSLSDYFQDAAGHDHFFGFLDVGCDLEAPIGHGWAIRLSAHAVILGEATRESNHDLDVRIVLTAGLSWSF